MIIQFNFRVHFGEKNPCSVHGDAIAVPTVIPLEYCSALRCTTSHRQQHCPVHGDAIAVNHNY